MIAWPLGLYDCCGVSDGAAAAIITTPEIARSFRRDYVLVKGLGLAVGSFGILRDDWDFVHFPRTFAQARPLIRTPESPTPARKSTSPACTTASPSPS